VPGEGPLRLPTLTAHPLGPTDLQPGHEQPDHLPTVESDWNVSVAGGGDRNNSQPDPQLLLSLAVVSLEIEGRS
jgi:hypothetical protein